jgi:hypothetical protein
VWIGSSIGGSAPTSGTADLGYNRYVDREDEARRIARAAKQARPRTPRWLVALSIVVGATCSLALAFAWYGNRDVEVEHGTHALTSTNGGFAAGLLVGIAIGVVATAAVLARRR